MREIPSAPKSAGRPNDRPKPFVWTKSPEVILAAVQRHPRGTDVPAREGRQGAADRRPVDEDYEAEQRLDRNGRSIAVAGASCLKTWRDRSAEGGAPRRRRSPVGSNRNSPTGRSAAGRIGMAPRTQIRRLSDACPAGPRRCPASDSHRAGLDSQIPGDRSGGRVAAGATGLSR